jgi:hypothetical protein
MNQTKNTQSVIALSVTYYSQLSFWRTEFLVRAGGTVQKYDVN